jgi:hypothetical protein
MQLNQPAGNLPLACSISKGAKVVALCLNRVQLCRQPILLCKGILTLAPGLLYKVVLLYGRCLGVKKCVRG